MEAMIDTDEMVAAARMAAASDAGEQYNGSDNNAKGLRELQALAEASPAPSPSPRANPAKSAQFDLEQDAE
eukprot:scaffold474535_cov42-Prasinocladus_malaysianus.AAC.1